ncbi:hypothetical protein [Snuella lapsa]|uniref:Uncharacterized protein n=1 Tax=Snuella lapsa TaxID=870481 RepID=A0ABP6YEB7_9FLAO
MDYQEKYNTLKEKIVDNFDYWLDSYIAIDISEAGEVDYLISDIDEYYFCISLEEELKFIIDALIDTSERELLIKFVGLKRALNRLLLANPHYNEEDFYNDDSESTKSISPFIKLHPNIKNKEKTLNTLYQELKSGEYIDCTKMEFFSIFEMSNSQKKVVWLRRQIDLLGLINCLEIKKIISYDNLTKAKLAFTYFKAKNKDFPLRSLEVTSTKTLSNDDKYKGIIDIVSKLIESN